MRRLRRAQGSAASCRAVRLTRATVATAFGQRVSAPGDFIPTRAITVHAAPLVQSMHGAGRHSHCPVGLPSAVIFEFKTNPKSDCQQEK
jgi:hypothetical protein